MKTQHGNILKVTMTNTSFFSQNTKSTKSAIVANGNWSIGQVKMIEIVLIVVLDGKSGGHQISVLHFLEIPSQIETFHSRLRSFVCQPSNHREISSTYFISIYLKSFYEAHRKLKTETEALWGLKKDNVCIQWNSEKLKNLLPSRAEGPEFLFSSASITSSGKQKVWSQISGVSWLRCKDIYWHLL